MKKEIIILRLQEILSKVRNLGKIQQDLVHEDIITSLAKALKPKVYVELGLYKCRLFNRMVPLVSEKLIGVDVVKKSGDYMQDSFKTEFYCGSTESFAKEAKKRNLIIDMLFIDADHSQQAVRKDFELFFPLVKQDGIILLHDAYPKNQHFAQSGYCGDGYKAIFELSKQTQEHELVTLPLHPGLAICRKRNKQVPWEIL